MSRRAIVEQSSTSLLSCTIPNVGVYALGSMAVLLTGAVSAGHVQPIDPKWFWSTREHPGYPAHSAQWRYKSLAGPSQFYRQMLRSTHAVVTLGKPAPLNLATLLCSNHVQQPMHRGRMHVGMNSWYDVRTTYRLSAGSACVDGGLTFFPITRIL